MIKSAIGQVWWAVLVVILTAGPSSAQDTACGGDLIHQSGVVTSPGYPDNYPNNKRCTWTVKARKDEIVDLRFNRLDLEGTSSDLQWVGETCPDYVRVYDGDSASSPLLASMCRIKTTEELANITIRSTSNMLFIIFQSDYRGQRPGFVASYSTHECPAFSYGTETCNSTCSCIKENTAYCNNTNGECVCKKGWTSSDCSQDVDECAALPKVELCPDYKECANNIGSFDCVCKAGLTEDTTGACEVKPESVCDPGNSCSHLCVKISSQEQCYCPDNMKLVGNTCQACSNVEFGKDCRLRCNCIQNNTQSCDPTTGGCICLKGWTASNCSQDIDECADLLENICPNSNDECVNSPGGYHCGCSGTLTDSSGVIQSPNYPKDTTTGGRCNWTIIAGGSGMTVSFSISYMATTYYSNDMYREFCEVVSVDVYDGTDSSYPLLGRYCGYYSNSGIMRSSGSTMFVVFRALPNRNGRFTATYSTSVYQVARTTTSDPSGIIASPGFPVSSSSNVTYSWTITVASNNVVNFSFSDINIGECGKDFVDVYDGKHAGGERLAQFCGNNRPRNVVSTNRSMHIIYSHVGSTSGKGFNGSYITDACWCSRYYTASCNYLTGPCVCITGVTGSYCDRDIDECLANPCPAHSTCYNTFASFTCTCWNGTKVNVNGSCDDWKTTLYGPTGEIQSQAFPNNYPRMINYTWSVLGKGKEVVTLRFSQFDVVGLDRCSSDVVEVTDGVNTDSKQIGQYCGKIIPGLLRSTKPEMNIYFKTSPYYYGSGKGFKGTYYVHECPLFMYGEEKCTSHCSCAYATTRVCDNTNGVCFCNPGWVGRGCSQDLDECRNPTMCPKNSECINEPGSYSCECNSGFEMDAIGQCQVSARCSDEMKQKCSHFCDVDTSTNTEKCYCPEDFVLLDDDATCVVSLYPHGSAAADNTATVIKNGQLLYLDDYILFNSLMPFSKSYQNNAKIMYNGVVMFNEKTIMSFPDLAAAQANKHSLLAPLWTENRKIGTGDVFYHVYETCSSSLFLDSNSRSLSSPQQDQVVARAIRDLKKFYTLPDFKVSVAFVVTWNNVETKDCRGLTNTFQAVLISGYTPATTGQSYLQAEEKSYVVYLYKDGSGICKQGQPFEVGIVTQNGFISGDIDKDDPQLARIVGNTGSVGVHTFPVGKKHNENLMCQRYVCKHADLIGNPHFQAEINELYQCPCSLDKLGLQWQLLKDEGDTKCYSIRDVVKRWLLRNNQRNRICCYTWTPPKSDSWEDWHESWLAGSFIPKGHLLVTDPWPGSQSLGSSNPYQDAVENMQARTWCCEKSPSEFCNRFNKIFGDKQCTIHPVFVITTGFGDPLLTSLDNKDFFMNGWGEYVLILVPSEEFTLQARTDKVVIDGKLSNGTVFTGFAAREGNSANVQVLLDTTGTSMVILGNGNDFTNKFYRDSTFAWSTATVSVQRIDEGNRITAAVTFACGVSFKVYLVFKSLEIDMEVDNSLRNKCMGLLGNNNGDPNDDFLLPNGNIISPDSTERQIFERFAKAYLVTPETSVFTYDKGESTADYQHPEFIPIFYDEIPSDQLSKAEAVCGKDDYACKYDYIVTGSEEFAKTTRDTKVVHEERKKRFKNNPPTITWSTQSGDKNIWLVNEGRVNIATVQVKDVDNDTVVIELLKNIRGVVLDQNGTITYTPDLGIPISLNIRAKDSVGSYSSILTIQISVCPTCNNHGVCDTTTAAAAEFFEGQYQILKCDCFPAYTGDACESELDACQSLPCTEGQSCRDLTALDQGNSSVGYVCGPCPTGTTNVEGFCEDIDECTDNTLLCDQVCINTYRDYKCDCRPGFRLDSMDSRTCIDINECEGGTSACEQVCNNTPGNYTCSCANGYTLKSDGTTCAIDANNAAVCQQCEQVCNVNSNGQVSCGCNLGFEVDGSNPNTCADIDECNVEDHSPCSQKCTNTVGRFVCSCNPGYKLDKNGASCLKCDSSHFGQNCSGICNCRGRGRCDRVQGCICNEHWTGANCDKDVNECRNPQACPEGMVCLNEPGSFSCECLDGYRLDNGVCLDIDECKEYTNNCDLDLQDCFNNEGNYSCLCKEGFKLNELTGVCEDIDECEQHNDDCEHICENGEGSYRCACHQGFRLATNRHSCEIYKQVCNFTCSHGCAIDDCDTPFCICPRGYTHVDTDSCADTNECISSDTNTCEHKDTCINTDGNHICSCEAGYRLENDGRSCVACSNGTWGVGCNNSCACGKDAISCDPVVGCECKPGCTGVHCTEVIDRCASGELTCQSNEECVVSGCSSVCQCVKGFVWENGQCQDDNECVNKKHNCDQVCINTPGSFNCSCNIGYAYNISSNTCIDVNECEQDPCSEICVNTDGSYHCSCPSGQVIQADGKSCDCPNGCDVGCSCVENNTDYCNKTNGQCFCKKGWTSDNCSVNADKCLRNSCPANRKCKNQNGIDVCVCWNELPVRSDGTCQDCDRTLTERSGYLMSSHYPDLYQDNTYCTWTIKVNDPQAVIELSFIDYNVEGCPNDYAVIYNGANRGAPLLAQVCDNWRKTYISKGNSLYIVFNSDDSDTLKGFLAYYTSYVPCQTKKCSHTCSRFPSNPVVEKCQCPDWMTISQSNDSNCIHTNACNSTITEPVGSIVSPNYPERYRGNSNCRWTIEGGMNSFIKLSFYDFTLEYSSKCTYDSLTIYNGNNETAPLIGRFCSNTIPPAIISSGNTLLIVFRADSANHYAGFKARYSIHEK